jgi:hypothetical protein
MNLTELIQYNPALPPSSHYFATSPHDSLLATPHHHSTHALSPLRAKPPYPLGSIPLCPSGNGRGCAALACYRSCGRGNDVIVAHPEAEAVRKPARGSMFQSRTI